MHYLFSKNRILRFFCRGAKVIPIASAHEDKVILEKAFVKIKKALDEGELVCLFPEGKITHNGLLNKYKEGINRILQETPVPVYPMVLKGMWGSSFSRIEGRALKRPFRRKPWSRVDLVIGEKMLPAQTTAEQLEAWTRNELRQDEDYRLIEEAAHKTKL